jgi:hypothetical protein
LHILRYLGMQFSCITRTPPPHIQSDDPTEVDVQDCTVPQPRRLQYEPPPPRETKAVNSSLLSSSFIIHSLLQFLFCNSSSVSFTLLPPSLHSYFVSSSFSRSFFSSYFCSFYHFSLAPSSPLSFIPLSLSFSTVSSSFPLFILNYFRLLPTKFLIAFLFYFLPLYLSFFFPLHLLLSFLFNTPDPTLRVTGLKASRTKSPDLRR